MINTEDKLAWCEEGACIEELFVFLFGHTLNLKINQAKTDDKYAPDLMHRKSGVVCELKSRRTPFFTAFMKYKLPIQHAVTINRKDIVRYQELYPGLPIYFWVRWDQLKYDNIEVEPMHGVWGIRLEKLVELCTDDVLHEYGRRINDTSGNAKDSYVVSLQEMKQLWSGS